MSVLQITGLQRVATMGSLVLVVGCASGPPTRQVSPPASGGKAASSRSSTAIEAASMPVRSGAARPASGPCPDRARLGGAEPSLPGRSISTVVDGVELVVYAALGVEPEGERRVVHVRVQARAVDGRCHGIVDEPLSIRQLIYRRRGTVGGTIEARGRSACIHDVRWLEGDRVVHLEERVVLEPYGEMVLQSFEVGVWELESSRPRWSLSPRLARVTVTGADAAHLRVSLESLGSSGKPFQGWYLGDTSLERCRR